MVVALDCANVDTDVIIPSQYLRSVKRIDFGVHLFDRWRYADDGAVGDRAAGRPFNPDFVLNQARYQGARILLARENFGCGSSREHAAWALLDYGFRVLIAPSFGEIFLGNAFKNGLLPIALDAATVDALFKAVEATPGYHLKVSLERQTVTTPEGREYGFEVDSSHKYKLMNGLDDIGLVLRHADKIRAYETRRRALEPWIFEGG